MNLYELCDRLDTELRTDAFADLDGSPNGLQVDARRTDVSHVAFAVDAAAATIAEALAVDADLLVTHHGLWWEGIERLDGRTFDRVTRCIEHDLALYVSHLPLDAHQQLGNAAGVADVLALSDREPFGAYHGEYLGQRGVLPDPLEANVLADRLETHLPGADGTVRCLAFGPSAISEVAILTGNGVDWLDDAASVGADVLVTGEAKHAVYHTAREAGCHVILAGHYATETLGVRNLAALIADWGLETTVIDHPTGL